MADRRRPGGPMPLSMRPTEGPAENIKMIEAGEAQVGFVTMGVAQQGWNGTGDWTGGKQYRAMRAMFPMYDTPFHFIVLQASGIQSIADLAGKRLGVGHRAGPRPPTRQQSWPRSSSKRL